MLLGLLLAGCYPNEQTRFHIWAEHASVKARYPGGIPPRDQLEWNEMEHLRSRYRLSDRDLVEIENEAVEKGWRDSHHCRAGPGPMAMHVLLVVPRPATEIEAATPETCRLGVQGVASVLVGVDAEGTVTEAAVHSGVHPVLDERALAAVRSTVWLPGRLCGQAVAAETLVNVPFNILPCGAANGAS